MLKCLCRLTLCQIALVAACALVSHAQDEQVCQTLANNLKPDILLQGSSSDRFQQIQQLLASSAFSSYGNASNSNINGGFDIPAEFDAAFGTSSGESSWGQNRSNFISMVADVVASSDAANRFVSQASTAALQAISNCAVQIANANGFFATLQAVSDHRDSFQILLKYRTNGEPGWKLTQFSAQPPDPRFKCTDDFQTASLNNKMSLPTTTQVVTCTKDPSTHFILGVQTTAGAATSFTLYSVNEEIAQIRQALQALANRLDKSSIVAAFAANTCPSPWVPYTPAAGRFIRGIDPSGTIDPKGTRTFGDLQDDGVGDHIHNVGIGSADSSTMVPATSTVPHQNRLASFVGDQYNMPAQQTTSGTPHNAGETRPKNVALLYCTLPSAQQ